MPSVQNITNIPAPRVEFIDPRTGLMSREWYRFFLNLFTLTGSGSNATSLEDLQLDSPYASEISSLEEKLNTLTQTVDTQLADTKAQQALDRFDNINSLLDFSALAPAQRYDNFVDTNYVDFEQAVPHVGAVGRMVWNDTDGTLDLGLKGGNVTLQIGQEQVVRVVNKSGADLIDGQVVYLSGAQGNRVKVDLAVANGSTSLARTVLGLVTEPIANNQEGFVTISGLVRGLNTSAFVDGDVLYLSTTPGQITNVRPSAPTHVVVVGFCVNANPAVGSILVSVQPGYDLEDLSDVAVTSPVDGNLLIYNATAQDWQNNLLTSGTGLSVANGPGTVAVNFAVAAVGTWAGTPSSANLAAAMTDETGSGPLVFATRPTLTTTVGVGGATASASGSGVSFPATQSASTDPNTLDDYEEGTWTLTVTPGSGAITSYTVQTQKYTKIGNLVTAIFKFTITNNGTGASYLQINLPFTSADECMGTTRENAITGTMGNLRTSGANAFILTYNSLYPAQTGAVITGTVTFNV